ncbi:MAG: hypothetical protein QF767_07525, partial [Alphaproteobacteria bacterium]|nr:hypothetical protein [Alphaproteobacteria bacterium]
SARWLRALIYIHSGFLASICCGWPFRRRLIYPIGSANSHGKALKLKALEGLPYVIAERRQRFGA